MTLWSLDPPVIQVGEIAVLSAGIHPDFFLQEWSGCAHADTVDIESVPGVPNSIAFFLEGVTPGTCDLSLTVARADGTFPSTETARLEVTAAAVAGGSPASSAARE
jgi:hypothetical protein